MNIAIYPGSFNPIHNGHIAIAKAALKLKQIDEVWLMVTPQNPLKVNSDLWDQDFRSKLSEVAVANIDGVKHSEFELSLPQPTYTVNTLEALTACYPSHNFSLLVGGDNILNFHKWFKGDQIRKNHQLIVYPRPGTEQNMPSDVTVIEAELMDISSTEIRDRLKQKESISDLVPHSIVDLILKKSC